MIRAALTVLLGFVASGVLGVVRTAIFSATFGTSASLDAFYAAQRVPETLFVLVAGGALGSSFLPVFARSLAARETDHAWKLASVVMTLSTGAAGVLALALAFLAPVLVPALLVPNATAAEQALTVSLTQVMLGTTVIFSVSGLTMGILNAHQRFLLPSLAISMNNVGLIVGALVLTRLLPPVDGLGQVGDHNVYGLAWGALLGAGLHLLVQLPGLARLGGRLRPLFQPRLAGVADVLRLMGPRVLGLAVVQINFAVNVAFASGMVDGSQVALNTAWFLTFFSLGIIAQSVGTALFPSLSALAASEDWDGFEDRLAAAVRGVLFLALPTTVGLMVLGRPVIALFFQRGAFTAESTAATAWALVFFAFGIAGHSLLELFSRAYYALGDTWTPVRVGVAAMLSNIALSLLLVRVIGDPTSLTQGPFAGLALANSLTTLLEGFALWGLMRRRLRQTPRSADRAAHPLDAARFRAMARAGLAAAGMGILVWLVDGTLVDAPIALRVSMGVLVGGVGYFGLAYLLRIEEVRLIPHMLLRRRRA